MRKKMLEIVIIKKFYLASEIAAIYNLSFREVVYEAAKVGALYRIHKIILVNRMLFEERYEEMARVLKECDSKLIKVREATRLFGLLEKEVLQIVSDAGALAIYGRTYLVKVNELEAYLNRFLSRVSVIKIDDLVDDL